MRLVGQKEAIGLLRKYGIPVTRSLIYAEKKDALHSDLGFPLVLKVISEKIVHKTEEGAVITGIKNRSELAHHLHDAESRFSKRFPGNYIEFMLQKQETGKEVIIGMKRDAQFGPVILFGMGGVFVEVFKDVSMRIAPVTKKEIRGMIEEVKAFRVLKGFRGEKGVRIDALVDILSKISRLSMKERDIAEIDFNPVMVNDRYATVVDARILKNDN